MSWRSCTRPYRPSIDHQERLHSMHSNRSYSRLLSMTLVAVCWAVFVSPTHAEDVTIRVGHFPNLTHMQGLIAHNMSRHGHGWFEQRLGSSIRIEWYLYNAGPSAMEAIFADSLDLTYVGPNPAINA